VLDASRLLVVQTAYLGDLVLTTPLVRELARARPTAEITLVTTRLGPDVFLGLTGVRETIVFDKRRVGVPGLLRLAARLSRARFDAALLPHRSHRSALLVRLARIPRRIGFDLAPGAWAYTTRVPYDTTAHATRRYLALATPLGGESAADPRPILGGVAAASGAAERLLEAIGLARAPFVALAPGSVWATKRWTASGFAQVACALRSSGLEPVLVGALDDLPACRAVEAAVPGLRSLAGRTTVGELAAVLARALALVANDSGAAHVASAVRTPVVSIFGPTVPSAGLAPVGDEHVIVERADLACRPCGPHGGRRCPLGHFRCMREIDAAHVLAALAPIVARRSARPPAVIAS
jgi:lipopolysaccharide heptosyltransferase II